MKKNLLKKLIMVSLAVAVTAASLSAMDGTGAAGAEAATPEPNVKISVLRIPCVDKRAFDEVCITYERLELLANQIEDRAAHEWAWALLDRLYVLGLETRQAICDQSIGADAVD